MKKIRLGVNIDHVATVRNARGEIYPSPLKAAIISQKSGADSITVHLREDRRHINDKDLKEIKAQIKIPINLEIALTKEMIAIAIKCKPFSICFVPEKRKEITTEGGLNLNHNTQYLSLSIKRLAKAGCRVSLFIESNLKDVKKAKQLGVSCVELHTGRLCALINQKKSYKKELHRIKQATKYAKLVKLDVHAGHGLTYESAKIISKIKDITELNIGHFLIGESIFNGLPKTIKKFRKIIK
jgi:pyridoxine 5-phosphate synthase